MGAGEEETVLTMAEGDGGSWWCEGVIMKLVLGHVSGLFLVGFLLTVLGQKSVFQRSLFSLTAESTGFIKKTP